MGPRLILILMALWLMPVAAAAECPGETFKPFFINGIMSEPEEGRIALQNLLNQRFSPGENCDILVKAAENRSYDIIADLCESALQLGLIGPQDECLDAVDAVRPGSRAFAEIALLFSDKLNDVDIETVVRRRQATLDAQMKLFRLALDGHPETRLAIVAHSQGNLFANEALKQLLRERGGKILERVEIVSVATPAPDVVGGGDPRPHTTLIEDFIHRVPGALLPNLTDFPEGACGLPWDCHSFVGTYLDSPLSRERIALKTRKAATLGNARLSEVSPSRLSPAAIPQLIRLNGSHLAPEASGRTAVMVVLPDRTITKLEGTQIENSTGTSIECIVTLANAGVYSFQLVDADAKRSNVLSVQVGENTNRSPTASFVMSFRGRTATSGGELRVAADPLSGEARVTFEDRSSDSDGQIVSRVWKTHTQNSPLSISDTSFTWGFTPGRYTVLLDVADDRGGTDQAVAVLEVVDSSRGPVADFRMSESRHGSAQNGEFRLLAEVSSGEARVTFSDASTDPDGQDDIVSRLWTVDSQPDPLSIGDTQFTWGFRPGGPYNVTLTVTDRAGAVSLSTQSITVLPADTRIWPMTGGNAARQGLSPFSGPAHEPVALWTFSTSAPVVGDIVVSGEGRIYFASDKLYALERDGSVYASASLPAVPGYTSPFMTSPAIDDENGFVYVGVRSPQSGWRLFRFDKQLNNLAVVAESEVNIDVMTGPTVSQGAVFFGTRAYWQSEAYAVGAVNWKSEACLGLNGGWYSAPTFGQDGSVYGICGTILPGPVYAVKLVKLDRQTGAVIREVPTGRGPAELMIDGQGNLRSGYQIFTGAIFAGAFLRWDADLNPLSGGSPMDYTTSRVSLLPDGVSTVKIGYRWANDSYLNFRGAVVWDLYLPSEHGPTVPSVDASGTVFVGNDAELLAVRSTDGSILWRVPTDGPVTTQPAIGGNSVVYVGTANGTVIAFVHFSMEL